MCFPRFPNQRPEGFRSEMGFDTPMLKLVLESFVEEVAEESTELILERPRFVTAVVVVNDESTGQLYQASCTRQLDEVTVYEDTKPAVMEEDLEIQRALRELLESREMLSTPRESRAYDVQVNVTESLPREALISDYMPNRLLEELHQSSQKVSKVQFPSLARSRNNV